MIGIVALLAATVGLFCWKSKQTPPVTTTQQATSATASQAAAPPPPPPMYAPPPPPPVEEEPDAGALKPVAKGTAAPGGTGGPVAPGPCGKCDAGQSSGALNSALTAKARSAQGCYQRALRTSEVSGSMTVSVQVSPTGSVCSASLASDSVHSSEVASCVLGRFRGQTFPPPSGGCVTVNIPISFTIKQ